ncbi:hypothetical protein ACRFH6_001074 [Listeria monocytogenes]|nr:hypothetical protein [Listeria monocytogenes]EHD1770946.1 hypothetical protein [Listeria monocytogenes]
MKKFYIEEDVFIYPEAYNKLIELNLVDFDVWYLIESGQATRRYHDLKERYPNRKLIPFARRGDNDDIACFEIGKENRVQLIHDFTTEGFEQRGEFDDLWERVESAVKTMVEYNREEENV